MRCVTGSAGRSTDAAGRNCRSWPEYLARSTCADRGYGRPSERHRFLRWVPGDKLGTIRTSSPCGTLFGVKAWRGKLGKSVLWWIETPRKTLRRLPSMFISPASSANLASLPRSNSSRQFRTENTKFGLQFLFLFPFSAYNPAPSVHTFLGEDVCARFVRSLSGFHFLWRSAA